MEAIKIKNYTLIENADDRKKCKVIKDEAGNEIGFEISGVLTTFNVMNGNGQTFLPNSYDKWINEYFVKNKINVPLCVLHNDYDIRSLCGHVKNMETDENGVRMTCFVPKYTYYYNLIKNLIDGGQLQGFSNYGAAVKYDYTDNGIMVNEFQLINVAIVATPSDVGGLDIENTNFVGFNKKDSEKEKEKEKEKESNVFIF